MRKMMHLGAGFMLLLCLLGAHAGGAGAGLGLWLCGSAASSPPHFYPYPRKRRAHGSRLFLAWAASACLLSILFYAEKALFPFAQKGEHGLFCVGASCFSVCLGGAALDTPIRTGASLLLGFFLLFLAVLFYFL